MKHQIPNTMVKVIDIDENEAKELRVRLGCPTAHKSVKEFVACEYPGLDTQGREILTTIHRHICHLRGREILPEKTIARPGKTKRLLREF